MASMCVFDKCYEWQVKWVFVKFLPCLVFQMIFLQILTVCYLFSIAIVGGALRTEVNCY